MRFRVALIAPTGVSLSLTSLFWNLAYWFLLPWSFTRDSNTVSRFHLFLTYRCLSCVPLAVGTDPAHFDLSLARRRASSSDWLVLHLQELVSLAYQVQSWQRYREAYVIFFIFCPFPSFSESSCYYCLLILPSNSLQISTSQFEGMQPIGVKLLLTIMDKVRTVSFYLFPIIKCDKLK